MHHGTSSGRRHSRARFLALVIFVVVALIVLPLGVGPALGAAAQDPASGTLRLFYWQAPTIVNPHLSPGTKDLSASRITYEPLASYDKDGNMMPFLAA